MAIFKESIRKIVKKPRKCNKKKSATKVLKHEINWRKKYLNRKSLFIISGKWLNELALTNVYHAHKSTLGMVLNKAKINNSVVTKTNRKNIRNHNPMSGFQLLNAENG